MIDDELKAIVLIILVASAAISIYPILEEGRIVEPFSELGVLGPNNKLGDYPREIEVGQIFNLFLYVGNHEGTSQYYQVRAKIGDQTQNISDTSPLEAAAVATWETILENESNTTIPIEISISQPGQNRRLVFELWKYDTGAHEFVYHQRWTQLWLNVTTTR
jgi:uncharacterized membrane protein